MRSELKVGNATVREIRPIDVKRAIDVLLFNADEDVTDEQWSAALFTGSDLIEGEVNDQVNAAFAFVNRAYLGGDVYRAIDSKAKQTLSIRRLNTIHDSLMNECAALQHHGHSECWLYGWGFFQAVQSLYQDK